jgi:hypothetical protein
MRKIFSIMFTSVLIVGMLICSPVNSSATWSQQFNESGVGVFDKMEIFMTSPDDFFPDPITGFTSAGWMSAVVNPQYVAATGPAVSDLTFNIKFDNDSSDPLAFDFLAFNGDSNLEAAHASWSGGGWTITAITYSKDTDTYNRTPDPVPEPATMLLLGSGLIGIAGFGRKKLFNK